MPVVSMREILEPAFRQRYGVGAFNIVNELTMAAVLDAAAQESSPVILQVSVKTVKVIGARLVQLMFADLASRYPVPATLHLDHCPDIGVIRTCLEAGWNSVLFDASNLSYEENLRQTKEVVAMARAHGAAVEGELEAVRGVEDGIGSEEESELVSLEKCVEFLDQTSVDSFAPAIGTAHGLYKTAPKIDFDRVEAIVPPAQLPSCFTAEQAFLTRLSRGLSQLAARRSISRRCSKSYIATPTGNIWIQSHRSMIL